MRLSVAATCEARAVPHVARAADSAPGQEKRLDVTEPRLPLRPRVARLRPARGAPRRCKDVEGFAAGGGDELNQALNAPVAFRDGRLDAEHTHNRLVADRVDEHDLGDDVRFLGARMPLTADDDVCRAVSGEITRRSVFDVSLARELAHRRV